ncbi:uncharacterized protein TNCV_3596541 [Trichonephila clavipes]|nr:uncharacterized protein TNCV_3596541 [Trichonephila clavipes]
MPLKTRRVEVLKHIKSAEARSLYVGMVQKFGQWGANSDVILVTGALLKIMRFVAKNLRVASIITKLKLSGAIAHGGQGQLCPPQYTGPLGAEMHKQMSQSGGQSEARLQAFKPPRKLGTHLSTHCNRDERLN